MAINNGHVFPPSHLPQWAYHSIAVLNEPSFLRNHISNTSVSTQVWCIPTPISAVIYLTTSKVTQKQERGKTVPPVPGHFRRRPSLSSSRYWLKHYSHMMQITKPSQRTTPWAEMLQVLFGKAILLWLALCKIRFWRHYHPPEHILPCQIPSPSLAAHLLARLPCEPDRRTDSDFNCNPAEISSNPCFCHSVLPLHSACDRTKSIRAV